MLLDLRPDQLQIVQTILHKHVPQYEVWAFGSRAKWTAKDYSDLDLCIVSDQPLSFQILGALNEDFAESDLPWKVDVVDWATTSASFRKIIEKDKVVVQTILGKAMPQERNRANFKFQESGGGGQEVGEGTSTQWKCTSLGELVDQGVLRISDGYRARNEELGGQGAIFLRAAHVKDTHIDFEGVDRFYENLSPRVAPKLSIPGDVVITTKGNSTGRTAFVTTEMPVFVYSPHLSYWRSENFDVVSPEFLRSWARGPEFSRQLATLSHSTDMAPYLSLVDQRQIKITLPPIDEQRAIAQVFCSLDDKIELNRCQNAMLEAMARALFQSWFVDFDPVCAKVEGHPPFGLTAETAALFPNSFEDSDLGKIPVGWSATTLADIVTERAGKVGSGNGHVILSAVASGELKRSDEHFTKQVYSQDTSKYKRVEQWDYAYNPSRINIGSIGMLEEQIIGAVSPVYTVLRPAQGYEWFLRFFLDLPQTKAVINQFCSGSVRQSLSFKDFAAIPVVLPPKVVAEAFSRRWQELNTLRQQLDAQSRQLAEVRDTLLPKLMSGELRVPETLMA
jgi:type I restriction enzyme S subunit